VDHLTKLSEQQLRAELRTIGDDAARTIEALRVGEITQSEANHRGSAANRRISAIDRELRSRLR